jgi:hydrogenase-4 component B
VSISPPQNMDAAGNPTVGVVGAHSTGSAADPTPRPPGAAGWSAAAGVATAVLGAGGAGIGVAGITGSSRPVTLGWLLPLAGVRFDVTPVGGWFMVVTGVVAVLSGVYLVGYARAEHMTRVPLAVMPLFVVAMLAVPAAGSVTTFLLAWELMAATSLLLVLSDHRRASARSAGVYYAVMTQLGFVMILLALVILTASGHSDGFADLASTSERVPPATRTVVFLLTLAGFGSKAGLLPLHAWLPRAHPEAPSPVSALMSAAMVTMGIYGIVRVDLQILGPGPQWWGLVLLLVGAASALYGALQASVATDLKRLLAYSTTENMGLITLALGAATLLAAAGAPGAAAVAVTAAMIHLAAHAAFKTAAFLAAGSVLAATGLRDLDDMGGLARRMPATTAVFGIAALGAAGLPAGAGFVAEWLLVQALIHAPAGGNTTLALAVPVGVGAVALTTGLAVAAMVKAFGVGFLARARTPAAAAATEVAPSMVAAMSAAAAACVTVAVAPAVLAPGLARVVPQLPAGAGPSPTVGWRLTLPGLAGSMSPGAFVLALAAGAAAAMAVAHWRARRRPEPVRQTPLWACGADGLTTRMQYTATSFAEPLQRVFDDVLRPDADVDVTHHAESQYMVRQVAFRSRLGDAVEDRLYRPVIAAVMTVAGWVRRAHTGSVHLYVAFGAAGLLIVVLVAR